MFTTPKTQKASTNTAAVDYVERGVPFMHASWSAAYESGDYVVRSYGTEIARWAEDGTRTVSARRYSNTTSKQQNWTARAWGVERS